MRAKAIYTNSGLFADSGLLQLFLSATFNCQKSNNDKQLLDGYHREGLETSEQTATFYI